MALSYLKPKDEWKGGKKHTAHKNLCKLRMKPNPKINNTNLNFLPETLNLDYCTNLKYWRMINKRQIIINCPEISYENCGNAFFVFCILYNAIARV